MSTINTLFTKVNQEYHIVITEAEGSCVAENESTAKKLIESNKIKEVPNADGVNEWHLILPKRNSLLVGETQELQTAQMSVESASNYMSIIGDLLAEGYSQAEAEQIVQDTTKWTKLKSEQLHQLLMILRESQLKATKEATNFTGVMSLRVNPAWELTDTLKLPVSLYNKIMEFVNGELTGWTNEGEKKKTTTITTGQLTSIEEKPNEIEIQ
jgi:hypothetical protein